MAQPVNKNTKKHASRVRDQFFGLPNILTYIRVILIPFVLAVLALSEETVTPDEVTRKWLCFAAFCLFALAALTDYFDGYIARSMGRVTSIGKLVDPIADKLLVLATLVLLVHLHRIEWWIVVLLLMREISVTGMRSVASAEGFRLQVIKTGKFKTAFQLTGILGLLLHFDYKLPLIPWTVNFHLVGKTLVIVSLLFSLLSASSYFRTFLAEIVKKERERIEQWRGQRKKGKLTSVKDSSEGQASSQS